MDVAIPIVFPDYLIAVDTPQAVVNVPDLLPFVDILPARVTIHTIKSKVPYLGHAGVLLIDGTSGLTKYFEYGRYDRAAKGLVRSVRVSDVQLKSGKPTQDSMKRVFSEISTRSGQGGAIKGAYIEVAPGKFSDMVSYAKRREKENTNPKRTPYDLLSNSCLHFAVNTVAAAGPPLPPVADPRPLGHIDLIRSSYPALDFKPPSTLVVEGVALP